MKKNSFHHYLILLFFISCQVATDEPNIYAPEFKDRREKTRYRQYIINGKTTYKQYCSSCHGKKGKGFKNLYPPLAQADFLLQNKVQALCIIRYGGQDTLLVNGVQYSTPMPAFQQITPIQLAELMTYISNDWGNQTGLISVQQINQFLDSCTSKPLLSD